MIILEWLTEYMTTPKMEMTTETEMLGLVAIGIIAFMFIGVCFGAWGIIDIIIKVRNKVRNKNAKVIEGEIDNHV